MWRTMLGLVCTRIDAYCDSADKGPTVLGDADCLLLSVAVDVDTVLLVHLWCAASAGIGLG